MVVAISFLGSRVRPSYRRGLVVAALALAGGIAAAAEGGGALLHHIHGLAFSADGQSLYVPSHHGLAVWSGGRWSKAPGPAHDYMGFYAARGAFYSSGHPARGSGLVNPFGLIRSIDGGRSWRKLGLEGESDFHLLAVGYETQAVWVVNETPNSRMRAAGLYWTDNDGLTWHAARGGGVAGEIGALAAHPKNKAVVAVATDRGVYVSTDAGGSFTRRSLPGQPLSLHFDRDGDTLLVGLFTGDARLARIDWARDGAPTEYLVLPPLIRDAPSHIAQSPAKRERYAIATFERHVFVSDDGGRQWTQIATAGEPVPQAARSGR